MRLGVDAALVDGRLVSGDVAIDGGRIQAVGLDGVGRGIAVPGFVDLQVNGFAGVDFLGTDADGFTAAGEALLETGVTAYLPTLITSEEADLLQAIASVPLRAVFFAKVSSSSHIRANARTSARVSVPMAVAIGANSSQTTAAPGDNVDGFATAPAGGTGSAGFGFRFPGLPRNTFNAEGCGRRPEFSYPMG